jgi:alkyl hydroperoxide reductase subunit AhpC
MSALMQTSGLGSLKHNSVLISWPRDFDRKCSTTRFNKTLRAANATGLACMGNSSDKNSTRIQSTII